MIPTKRLRRPDWLRQELSCLEAEAGHLRTAIASLETYCATHGDDTESEVILGLQEARDRLTALVQRRQVLVAGWRALSLRAERALTGEAERALAEKARRLDT